MALSSTHGGKGSSRRKGDGYSSEWERIHGDSVDVAVNGASAGSSAKTTYVYDAKLGRLKKVGP